MFEALGKLFAKAGPAGGAMGEGAADPARLAVAALLVEAAQADETYADAEATLIDRLLTDLFGLAGDEARALRREAEARVAGAVDLHQFTRHVKALAQPEKIAVVEALWRVALSDGRRDPWEDMLIRRVAGLIHVEDVESALARRRAEAARED